MLVDYLYLIQDKRELGQVLYMETSFLTYLLRVRIIGTDKIKLPRELALGNWKLCLCVMRLLLCSCCAYSTISCPLSFFKVKWTWFWQSLLCIISLIMEKFKRLASNGYLNDFFSNALQEVNKLRIQIACQRAERSENKAFWSFLNM